MFPYMIEVDMTALIMASIANLFAAIKVSTCTGNVVMPTRHHVLLMCPPIPGHAPAHARRSFKACQP